MRRRPPTSFWIKERPGPSPGDDAQRLTLYLPARLLDAAEGQAARAGDATLQSYCERLLAEAIESERARESLDRRGALAGLDAIANDPEYLVEWTASNSSRDHHLEDGDRADEEADPGGRPADPPRLAASTVFRHAGMLGDDPNGFLPALRRAEPVAPDAARDLIQALADLETEHRDASAIDRRLAYALHRLAFEGQVLSESWQGSFDDPTTLDLLRMVQESVDRVLSGEDIRYYPDGS